MTKHKRKQLPNKHETLSFGVFILIVVGLFFLSTQVYPKLVLNYQNNKHSTIINKLLTTPTTQAPVSKEEALAPFVRGITSGTKSAYLSSQKARDQQLSIASVKGFQNGAQVAVLTSLNWYNLNRELFHSSGLQQGVLNAINQSKINPLQFQLGYQLELVHQISNALKTNIEELLNGSINRESTLFQFVGELKRLQEQAQVELAYLSQELSTYKSDWQAALNQQDAASEAFKNTIQQNLPEKLEQNIADFQSAGTDAIRLRAQHNAYLSIFQNLQPLALRIPPIITAIEANAEALVAGIKVAPSKEVNLPLFQ
jgi:hypothetical protein